ncbi:beta-mannosidase [Cohnella sp. 56]|uniref:beta-mannosidase n=1 Tax=Cohnella sp. 56 TaxID=3113722 RepID=UPI0030E8A881
MQILTLDGKWQYRRLGEGQWREGLVPGTLLGDMLRGGEVEDPFYRDNEARVLPLFDHDYEYRRTFAWETGKAESRTRRLLRFEGLDTLAEVELNGRPLFASDNMFRTYEVEVGDLLVQGSNELRVVFRSSVAYMRKRQAEYALFGIPMVVEGYTYLRKAHHMSGWDWGPKLPDCGIWRSVKLLSVAGARWDDVLVRQRHELGRVQLNVALRADRIAEDAYRAQVTVEGPDGFRQVRTVQLNESASVDVEIDNPQLWWPNGFGEQPLYRVEAALLDASGSTLDQRSLRVGLRELTVNTEPDEWGSAFAFQINGVDIFSMGADYIPEDNVLGRLSRERSERLVRDCVRANFNTIRVWGGGFYPDDYFYDLCDEYGLIVWQDFMFACGVYPLDDGAFIDNAVAELADNVKRIRHHASIGLICGNNEIEMFFEDGRIANTEENRRAYVSFFEERLPALVGELAPDTFYWPGSPSSGGDFFESNGQNHGDGHYWDVWHGNQPFTDYRNTYFRYMSEFGFESLPDYRTTLSFTEPEDRNLFSYVMECHQKNPAGNQKILAYLAETFRYPKDLRSLGLVSQLMQAEAMRYGVEHWRRHRGRCMGALYWQLNDCWPTLSWASIDYFGRWKALHYFARRFFAPVLLSACETETDVSLHIANERLTALQGNVSWALKDMDGGVLESGGAEFKADPLSAICVAELDFAERLASPDVRRRVYLEYALESDGAPASLGTAYFAPAKYVELKHTDIRADVTEEADRFVVELSAPSLARYVELSFWTLDGLFDDNYFDLPAGTVRRIGLPKAELSKAASLDEIRAELTVTSLTDTY